MNINDQRLTKRERRELKRQEKAQAEHRGMRSRTVKRNAIWVTVVIVVGFGVWGLTRLGNESTNTSVVSAKVEDGDWVTGNRAASVVLVEYLDFQCPACRSYHPLMKQLNETYGEKLAIVSRNYPLVSIHPNAMAAARAAEAAGKQGKFFEYHDILFDKQSEWSAATNTEERFISYAQSLSLDVERLRTDMKSSEIDALVKADIASGNALRVNSTPSFFLQGTKIQNPSSLEDFKKLIDDALANAPLPTGDDVGHYHAHFGFKIYLDGKAVDLTQAKYQSTEAVELDPDVHVHDGNGDIVHVHAETVTIGEFLTSLGMALTNECLTHDDGTKYCASGAKTLKFLVNGEENAQFADYKPQDLERIIISYGSETGEKLEQQKTSVSDEACIYSEKCPERGEPPTENCVGGLGTEC